MVSLEQCLQWVNEAWHWNMNFVDLMHLIQREPFWLSWIQARIEAEASASKVNWK
jgi:hypothetical protein